MIGASSYSNSVRSDGGAGVETATCVNSEETDDVPIVVQVDLPGVRLRGQPGHGPHLAEERVEKARAHGRPHVADRHAEAPGPALERGVVERLRCVFAMQTGRFAYPRSVYFLICCSAAGR